MKRFGVILCLIVFMAGFGSQAWAVTFSGQAPKTGDAGNDLIIQGVFDTQIANINNTLVGKYASQDSMASAFADANAYAASNTSMWAYQGYDLFQIMINGGLSTQLPSFSITGIEDELQKIEDEGDAEVGVGFSGNINVGVNLSLIGSLTDIDILKKMTADIRFMTYSFDTDNGDFNLSYDYIIFGLGVHYKLLEPKSVGFGLFKWRGVTVGTGIIYQKNSIDLLIPLDSTTTPTGVGSIDLVIDPSVNIGMEITTVTIPFDISTSFRLLYIFNVAVGAGVDVTFGSNDITTDSGGGVTLTNTTIVESGYISGDAGSSGNAAILNPKLMASIGINAGPAVLINASAVYYIPSGAAVTLSAGVVW